MTKKKDVATSTSLCVLRLCAHLLVTARGLYGRVGAVGRTDAGHVAVVARTGCERVVVVVAEQGQFAKR